MSTTPDTPAPNPAPVGSSPAVQPPQSDWANRLASNLCARGIICSWDVERVAKLVRKHAPQPAPAVAPANSDDGQRTPRTEFPVSIRELFRRFCWQIDGHITDRGQKTGHMIEDALDALDRAQRNSELNYDEIVRLFHDTYEQLAPSFGYETRKDTKKFDPESPNGKLMWQVCQIVADSITKPIHVERDALRARVAELEGDVVPRSRYDACNQDWLEAKSELSTLMDKAKVELKAATSRADALERECESLKLLNAADRYEVQQFHALCARLWLAVGPDPEKVTGETCDEKLVTLLQTARADCAKLRECADKVADQLADIIEVADAAMRQPESEFDRVAELKEPRQALASYRALQAPTAKSEGGGK